MAQKGDGENHRHHTPSSPASRRSLGGALLAKRRALIRVRELRQLMTAQVAAQVPIKSPPPSPADEHAGPGAANV